MSRPLFGSAASLLAAALIVLTSSLAGAAPTQGSALSGATRLAYLDPGSGSFMVQALIAALAGIGIAGRRYWTQIKTWLGLETRAPEDEFDPDDE